MTASKIHSVQKNIRLGFTVVELLVVVVIIGILATLGILYYNGSQSRALDVSVLSDLDNMDGAQTRYGTSNILGGKEYYSGLSGTYDSDLDFKPSSGNVIDVVIDSTDYCIRGYNVSSSYSSINNAATKESSPGICDQLGPSIAAGGSGTSTPPIAWWKLNGNANDSSGSGNNGSVFGATSSTGQNGQANSAYAFSGGQFIRIPANHSVSSGTVSLWFKTNPPQPASTGGWYIFSHPQTTGNNRIYLRTNTSGDSAGLYLGSGTTIGSISISSSTWYSMVGTWSGTSASFYLNGQNVTSTSLFNGLTSAGLYSYLGCYSSSGDQCISGNIDDVRIYNYALSPSEVSAVYSAGAQ